METYFYIDQKYLKEVENLVSDYDLRKPIQCLFDGFSNFEINKPVLKLVNKDKGRFKFVMLLSENTNEKNIFHRSINLINDFNNEYKKHEIVIVNVNGVYNHFKGSILVDGVERVIFELITPSMLLSYLYEF